MPWCPGGAEWLSRHVDDGYVHVDPVIRKIRVTTSRDASGPHA